ncbi:MAG: hypothetical protein QM736_01475 [Vicinamibacterales bacterium]
MTLPATPRTRAYVLSVVAALAITGCSRGSTRQDSPAETQQGSATTRTDVAREGAARANCSDLPSADDFETLAA